MKTLEFMLESYKELNGIKTHRALANSLGVSESALHNYRNGDRRMPDMAMIKLAEGIDASAEEVMAAMNSNLKTATDHELKFWVTKLVEMGSRYAMHSLAMIVFVNLFLTPTPSQATPLLKADAPTICIM